MADRVGQRFGDYQLLRFLGEGTSVLELRVSMNVVGIAVDIWYGVEKQMNNWQGTRERWRELWQPKYV